MQQAGNFKHSMLVIGVAVHQDDRGTVLADLLPGRNPPPGDRHAVAGHHLVARSRSADPAIGTRASDEHAVGGLVVVDSLVPPSVAGRRAARTLRLVGGHEPPRPLEPGEGQVRSCRDGWAQNGRANEPDERDERHAPDRRKGPPRPARGPTAASPRADYGESAGGGYTPAKPQQTSLMAHPIRAVPAVSHPSSPPRLMPPAGVLLPGQGAP